MAESIAALERITLVNSLEVMMDRVIPAIVLVGVLIAGTGPVASPSVPAAEVTHCVVEVVGVSSSRELVVSQPVCFETFAEAIGYASGGSVTVSAGSESFTNPEVGALLSTFTLGIHFDGYNGAGSSITVVGDSCIGGYWNTGAAWANRISSSYNGCYRVRHHDLANKGGSYGDTLGAGSTHNVPWWIDNRTESVSYWGS
jgi:hypothetical protein